MIYLDNAATTYPKPLSVKKAVAEAVKKAAVKTGVARI